MKNKNLYLLRGLPGSGKSTLAKKFGGSHFEADQYFMQDSQYNFDVTKLKDAHQWCQSSVELAMIQGHILPDDSVIVVSNTFTQEWEMKPYYDMAKTYGYTVFSLIVENRHGGVNEHGVPEDKLEAMRVRFEFML